MKDIEFSNNTITFTTKCKKYDFTVTSDFVKLCPEYQNTDVFSLLTLFKLNKFLHNQNGDALMRHSDGYGKAWIRGERNMSINSGVRE